MTKTSTVTSSVDGTSSTFHSDTNVNSVNISLDSDMDSALKKNRKRESNIQQIALKIHQRKLSTLIKCNGREKVTVSTDGKCLFEATAIQLEEDKDKETNKYPAAQLREHICAHNEESY